MIPVRFGCVKWTVLTNKLQCNEITVNIHAYRINAKEKTRVYKLILFDKIKMIVVGCEVMVL